MMSAIPTVKDLGKLLIVALLLLVSREGLAADPRSNASFYVDTYGLVTASEEPLVARANDVFAKVLQVADRKANRSPGLRVINSDGQPWAIALPDGYIVLSRGALRICYEGVSEKDGDARLAFILGHELAHLASNDFWHREVYLSLSGQTNKQSLADLRVAIGDAAADLVRQRELAADDTGFLYASMSGFDTASLLGRQHGADGFFDHWVKQTRGDGEASRVDARQRTDFLQTRFKDLASRSEIFNFGVRLSHFGRYDDAIHFFRDFQRAFPSREVFNNLGYAHLQLARRGMNPEMAYRYWLPTVLDTSTRLVAQMRSIGGNVTSLSDASRRDLEKAVDFLAQAVQSDRWHIPSRLNLVSAYMYLGEFHKARAVVEEARKIRPDNPDVLALRALVLFEQEREIDMFPVATGILSEIAQRPNSPAHVYFNLARLYEGRGRIRQAERFWGELAARADRLPAAYRDVVCASLPDAGKCPDANRVATRAGIIPTTGFGIGPGDSIDSKSSRKVLRNWTHTSRAFGPIKAEIYVQGENAVLALDEHVEVLVIRDPGLSHTDQLESCCGRPIARIAVAEGEIWAYADDWAALVRGSEVQELWIATE